MGGPLPHVRSKNRWKERDWEKSSVYYLFLVSSNHSHFHPTTTTTLHSHHNSLHISLLSLILPLLSLSLSFPLFLFLSYTSLLSLIPLFYSLAVIRGVDMDLSTETPKRRSSDSSSPEFEFCVVGNLSHPQQELLTADELFVDGVLLPLHLLSVVHSEPDPEPELAEPLPDASPPPPLEHSPASITSSISSSTSSGSKRWKDIFKVGEKKGEEKEGQRRERRSGGGAAELNINIWPFSRSRSAGNGAAASRPRASAMAGRKASSAPCSRSNSRGESSKPSAAGAGAGGPTRRWAASPGRAGLSGGVHMGRTSPVWQIRRGEKRIEPAAGRGPARANQRDKATGSKKGSGIGGGVRVLNLNVNTSIGYRNQVSCRGDDKDGVTTGDRTAGEGAGSNRSFFSLRSFFSKKVY